MVNGVLVGSFVFDMLSAFSVPRYEILKAPP